MTIKFNSRMREGLIGEIVDFVPDYRDNKEHGYIVSIIHPEELFGNVALATLSNIVEIENSHSYRDSGDPILKTMMQAKPILEKILAVINEITEPPVVKQPKSRPEDN